MPRSLSHFVSIACLVLAGGCAVGAHAASSASSEVSGSVSTSVGSLSDSVRKSSDSSSKGKDVAAGDYRLIEVAAADDRPGLLRLKLQALAGSEGAQGAQGAGDFDLLLPQEAVQRAQLVAGAQISARQRPYGVEFSAGAGADHKAFFLVMQDDWYRELNSRPVTL
jgi:hypothetical protein